MRSASSHIARSAAVTGVLGGVRPFCSMHGNICRDGRLPRLRPL